MSRKRKWIATLFILFLMIPVFAFAHRQYEPAEHERGRRGGMWDRGMMRAEGRGMQWHALSGFFAMMQKELALSEEQIAALEQIRLQALKDAIQRRAAIQVAELELRELLMMDPVDLAQAEAKVREIENLRTEKRIAAIQLYEKAKEKLTAEQRKQLQTLARQMLWDRKPHRGQTMRQGEKEPMRERRGPQSE